MSHLDLASGSLLESLLVAAVREHNVIPLTGNCNLSCVFCSHRQNPPGTQAFSFPPLPEALLHSLMAYLDPDHKIIIGESATRLREGEPLAHPQFIAIVQKLRLLNPDTPIQITTNGALLDKSIINRLASLKPLELVISLNSASEHGRKALMNDSNPNNVFNAVNWLHDCNIAFHGSLVLLPHLIGWDDLQATIEYLDRAGAVTIRALLPGYTKQSDPALLMPDVDYQKCFRMLESLRNSLSTPLLAEPPFIENLNAFVEGVIRDSPAWKAGLLPGDQIILAAGRKVLSRVDAYQLLSAEANPLVEINRRGKMVKVALDKESNKPAGVAVAYDLDPGQVDRVRSSLLEGGETLMLVSEPALKRWTIAAEKFNLRGLKLQDVHSVCFGGSIKCAGLLAAKDFQVALDRIKELKRFKKILLPAVAFDRSGRDLFAESYLNIRTGGITMQLVD